MPGDGGRSLCGDILGPCDNGRMSSESEHAARGRIGGVIVAWVGSVVIGLLIALLTPVGQRAAWLTVGVAGCLVLSFAVQLWSGRAEGFISRVALSMLGSFIVLGLFGLSFGLAALA